MSGPDLRLAALLFLLLPPFLQGQEFPDPEPSEGGARLLAGRLPWGTTALPAGEILAPAEDRSLAVLDGEAREIARWPAPARFSAPVTAGPRSAFQLAAAPMINGRVEILVWDGRTKTLAPVFAASQPAEATASAWGASGTVHLGWKNGRVEAWSSKGALLWSAEAGFEVRFLLVDETLGLYVGGPGRVALYDFRGQESDSWPLEGTPGGVLQTMGGDLYSWTEKGLWKKARDGTGFAPFVLSPGILGAAVDRQDRLVVTESLRLRRFSASGGLVSQIPLPFPAVTASALDDRGRILAGTTRGVEVWTYDGRLLAVMGRAPPAAAPQLSAQGLASWGGADWSVHVWQGFRLPAFGWPQDGGTPGRSFAARRPTTVASRAVNWTDDPEFSYLYQLAASGEEAKQREVLERFEAKPGSEALLEAWPFANLILLKIARSGLTDLILDRKRVVNNWPGLRLRAFALLSRTAGPEDRDELVALLQREHDPSVAAQGALALAQSGWDGDGRILRLLDELQRRMPGQAAVADAVIDAARNLWVSNGYSADPVLVPLVGRVYQGPYPRSIKLKAQKFFQDLLEAP